MNNNDEFFPLFINLENKNILVLGAGKIAFRKVSTVANYRAKVTIISKDISDPRFNDLIAQNSSIKISIGEFSKTSIKKICLNSFLVILATDNKELNKELAIFCDENNILVNNITSKTLMNTRFPSLLKQGEYTLGISANGNPKKSKALKNKLSSLDLENLL